MKSLLAAFFESVFSSTSILSDFCKGCFLISNSGYLTFKLHHLYLALKNHENRHYNQLSSQVFIMSVREVGKYFGITRNNVNDYIQILKLAVLENQDTQSILNSNNFFFGKVATGVLGATVATQTTVIKTSIWSKIRTKINEKINHAPPNAVEWFDSLPQSTQDVFAEKMMQIVEMKESSHR
jgi:hypothetical protein